MREHLILSSVVVRPYAWNEVFGIWRQNEEHLPHWQEVWTDAGFESWADWRMGTVRDLRLADRRWYLYNIESPDAIAQFSCGLYKEWREPLSVHLSTSYIYAVTARSEIQNSEYIRELKANFPRSTTLIGLYDFANDRMYIVDGTQRCFAYSLAVAEGNPPQSCVNIVIAHISHEELRYLLGMTPRGKALNAVRKVRKRILGR